MWLWQPGDPTPRESPLWRRVTGAHREPPISLGLSLLIWEGGDWPRIVGFKFDFSFSPGIKSDIKAQLEKWEARPGLGQTPSPQSSLGKAPSRSLGSPHQNPTGRTPNKEPLAGHPGEASVCTQPQRDGKAVTGKQRADRLGHPLPPESQLQTGHLMSQICHLGIYLALQGQADAVPYQSTTEWQNDRRDAPLSPQGRQ